LCNSSSGAASPPALCSASLIAPASFLCSIPFLVLHFAHGGCSGFQAWCFNVAFNLILVLLFARFHRQTYAGKGRAKAA